MNESYHKHEIDENEYLPKVRKLVGDDQHIAIGVNKKKIQQQMSNTYYR